MSHIYNLAEKYQLPDNWVASYVNIVRGGDLPRGIRRVSYTIAPVYCGNKHFRVIQYSFIVPMARAKDRQWRENRLRRLEALARGLVARGLVRKVQPMRMVCNNGLVIVK